MIRFKKAEFFIFTLLLLSVVSFCRPAEANSLICPAGCENQRPLSLQQPFMAGDDVRELQEQLYFLGYYNELKDGVFGPKTAQAVQTFQEFTGLKPNGLVDDETWLAMGSAMQVPVSVKAVPPPKGKISIIIDTTRRTLTVFSDGEPYRQYAVAVGKHETPTPIGTWKVQRKAMNWGTGFGTRWMGLNVPWGIYGIHGTNKPGSIGSYASHGCIRMNNVNVEQIYPWIPTGTPVIIVGNSHRYQDPSFRVMRRGDRGADVMEVQRAFKRLGYYDGKLDGIWGWGLEQAIYKFRAKKGLPKDNSVDSKVYKALGL